MGIICSPKQKKGGGHTVCGFDMLATGEVKPQVKECDAHNAIHSFSSFKKLL